MAWEATLSIQIPTMDDMNTFLEQRCQMTEALDITNLTISKNVTSNSKPNKSVTSHLSTSSVQCVDSTEGHTIYRCSKFLALAVNQGIIEVKNKLCLNYLRNYHKVDTCLARKCRTCNGRLNSLLNWNKAVVPTQSVVVSNHCAQIYNCNVLLSTAIY